MDRGNPVLRFSVPLDYNLWFGVTKAEALKRALGRMGASDVYLTPDLGLAAVPRGAPVPMRGGLMATHLGTFRPDIPTTELIAEIQHAIESVCPAPLSPADEERAPPPPPPAHGTGMLSRLVEFEGEELSIQEHGRRRGIPRGTLIWRLRTRPDIPLEELFQRKINPAQSRERKRLLTLGAQ